MREGFGTQLKSKKNWLVLGTLVFMLGVTAFIWRLDLLTGNEIDLEHKETKAEESPIFLGEIKLRKGSRPLWVASYDNRLYVSYFAREEIDVLSLNGSLIKTISFRLGENKTRPQGMAMIEDKMMVADYDNGSLGIIDKNGKVVDGFFEKPDKSKINPVGIDSHNLVYYVTDALVNGWMAIGNDGYLINVVKGEGESYLRFPFGIAVTKDGRVLVTDPPGGKVIVYSCSGNYAFTLLTAEVGLKNPQGIAIDSLDRIHIVDNAQGKVYVFDNEGKYLFVYGEDLENPSTVAIDPDSRCIYVTNTNKSSLSVWGY